MASQRKIAANRRNAARSTGPKTAEGKARSRGNALRHALSIPVTGDPRVEAGMVGFARALTGRWAIAALHREAREVTAAFYDLRRVRLARTLLQRRIVESGLDFAQVNKIERSPFGNLTRDDIANIFVSMGSPLPPLTLDAPKPDQLTVEATLEQLTRFERYERRALSRRNKAVRNFARLQRFQADEDEEHHRSTTSARRQA